MAKESESSAYTVFIKLHAGLADDVRARIEKAIGTFFASVAAENQGSYQYYIPEIDSFSLWRALHSLTEDQAYFCQVRHKNHGLTAFPESLAVSLGDIPRTDLDTLLKHILTNYQSLI